MSEYQYYEFQALDQPLSQAALNEMNKLSSRVQLTATSASFVYNYGDFRGDPYYVLLDYFDVMLYIANWGSRRLMFRFPASAVDIEMMKPYTNDDELSVARHGDYVVLNIDFPEEEAFGWIDGEGYLSGLISLRNDMMRGDLRALYLAWLKVMSYEAKWLEDDEDLPEPPVPPNLQKLNASLHNFVAFFDIDEHLITAAAEASPTTQQTEENLEPYLSQLPQSEKDDFLLRVLRGESHLNMVLANRLKQLAGKPKMPQMNTTGRGVRAIIAAAEVREKQQEEEERRQAEIKLKRKMTDLKQREEALWESVTGLIEQKKTSAYDDAILILKDLISLARYENRLSEFQDRIRDIKDQFPTLRGLHSRLKRAGLL